MTGPRSMISGLTRDIQNAPFNFKEGSELVSFSEDTCLWRGQYRGKSGGEPGFGVLRLAA